MKKSCILMVFLVLQCNSALLWAQTEPEEIKLDTDQFQEFFYESLLQKGIENYDKAIVALDFIFVERVIFIKCEYVCVLEREFLFCHKLDQLLVYLNR